MILEHNGYNIFEKVCYLEIIIELEFHVVVAVSGDHI